MSGRARESSSLSHRQGGSIDGDTQHSRGDRPTSAVAAHAAGTVASRAPLIEDPTHKDFAWREVIDASAVPTLAAALAALSEKLARGAAACVAEYNELEALQARLARQLPATAALAATGLNRYSDVMPYDHNRVRLLRPLVQVPAGRAGSRAKAAPTAPPPPCDYINASLLSNPDAGDAVQWRYIAAQGPLRWTTAAFWQMVVEQGVTAIVMLTRATEGGGGGGSGGDKCAPYFCERAGSCMRVGGMQVVTQEEEEVGPELYRRRITVGSPEGAAREVVQFHFADWPDHGVPPNPAVLLTLCALLRASTAAYPAPILVHCSAGIGRTGVFCVLDIALRRLLALAAAGEGDVEAARRAVDVRSLVERLRRQRAGMVQTPAQYVFCHQALAMFAKGALRIHGAAPLGKAGGG